MTDINEKKWIEGFEKRTHPYYKFVFKNLKLEKGDVILDIGCGTADFTTELHKDENAENVIGVDMTKKSILLAREKDRDLKLVIGSVMDLPFKKNVANKCIALEMLEHLGGESKISKALGEISRVLDSRGTYIMTTPNRGNFLKYVFLL